ncbi:MAG: phosphoribosyl-AMP cyclohydrolase [Candidatus Omnitrophica bacterium]|nr:phosphoribosyl-AMP cyclohydrolase [Candidatus Omnitrophota bacterium]
MSTNSSFIDGLTFNSDGHIPAVIQDQRTQRVLTLCYMTKEALEYSIEQKFVYVYRRSLGKLMKKGETSGHVQEILDISKDCEGKSLLIQIKQHVAGCHKGFFSCYFESLQTDGSLKENEALVFNPSEVYKK